MYNCPDLYIKKPELIFFCSFQPLNLCDIEGVSGISVSKEDEVNRRVEIQIKDPAKEVYMIT